MDKMSDNIEIILPFKAEYVSIARLTASGIANRIGFDVDTIEDIKVAIAEVCNKLVKVGSKNANSYRIRFEVTDSSMDIFFDCEDKLLKCIFDNEADELGISLITALMDNAEFCTGNDYIFSMSKTFEGNN